MASPNDPNLISSYELVSRSLENSINYDNLSDAEKSRARKRRVRRRGAQRTLWQRIVGGVRNVDMFWALTGASVLTFVLIALSLLYFRHSRLALMQRFSHEELSARSKHLGFGKIYVVERVGMHGDVSAHRERWAEATERLGIEVETWPATLPTAPDPRLALVQQRECWRPHQAIYREIAAKGPVDALIVEDSVDFGPSPQLRLYSALSAIPADWDVLQLGPVANGSDSGRHDDIHIHGSQLVYRRVDDGACNTLAYAISRAGARKIVATLDATHAHADFEHQMLDSLDRARFLMFRVSPGIFTWRGDES
ncbi:hypothetical protein H4217_004883 [Coemansia sp. RSA 1939]|nr:hypothetical protein H4217_004883 [Coemansia sp. RSA 1939]